MIVKKIYYTPDFLKRLQKLPNRIQLLTVKKENLFRENPLHPSLRLHQLHGNLKGVWSLSINREYRIIFERLEDGDLLFHSIGRHDVYRSL